MKKQSTKTGVNLLMENFMTYYHDQYHHEQPLVDFPRPSLLILNYDETKFDREEMIDLYFELFEDLGIYISHSCNDSIHQNTIPDIQVWDWDNNGNEYFKTISPTLVRDYETFVYQWCLEHNWETSHEGYISIEFKDFLKFHKKRMKELDELDED